MAKSTSWNFYTRLQNLFEFCYSSLWSVIYNLKRTLSLKVLAQTLKQVFSPRKYQKSNAISTQESVFKNSYSNRLFLIVCFNRYNTFYIFFKYLKIEKKEN